MLEIYSPNDELDNLLKPKNNLLKPKKPTFLCHSHFVKNLSMRNIFLQIEPEVIIPVREQLLKYADQFDYILTFDDVILQRCKNAHKYIYGTTWILPKDYENIDIQSKKFLLTSLTGCKVGAIGHKMRHGIYSMQNDIKSIPIRFYLSYELREITTFIPRINNNPYLPKERHAKIELFRDAQFSLVIENSEQTNYFTEKLCDCLITKTIPIYYGCPNISEFFDTTGWIFIKAYEDPNVFLEKLKILTPDYYMKYIHIINKNYETVKKYIDLNENINRTLRSIPEY